MSGNGSLKYTSSMSNVFDRLINTGNPVFLISFLDLYNDTQKRKFLDFSDIYKTSTIAHLISEQKEQVIQYLLTHPFVRFSSESVIELLKTCITISSKSIFLQLIDYLKRVEDTYVLLALSKIAQYPFIFNETKEGGQHFEFFKTILEACSWFIRIRLNKCEGFQLELDSLGERRYCGNLSLETPLDFVVDYNNVVLDKFQSKIQLVNALCIFIEKSNLKMISDIVSYPIFTSVLSYDVFSFMQSLFKDSTLSKYKLFLIQVLPFCQSDKAFRIDVLLDIVALPHPLDDSSHLLYLEIVKLFLLSQSENYLDICKSTPGMVLIQSENALDSVSIKGLNGQNLIPLIRPEKRILIDKNDNYLNLFKTIATHPGFGRAADYLLSCQDVMKEVKDETLQKVLTYTFINKLPEIIDVFAKYNYCYLDCMPLLLQGYKPKDILFHLKDIIFKLDVSTVKQYYDLNVESYNLIFRSLLRDKNNTLHQAICSYFKDEAEYCEFWNTLINLCALAAGVDESAIKEEIPGSIESSSSQNSLIFTNSLGRKSSFKEQGSPKSIMMVQLENKKEGELNASSSQSLLKDKLAPL